MRMTERVSEEIVEAAGIRMHFVLVIVHSDGLDTGSRAELYRALTAFGACIDTRLPLERETLILNTSKGRRTCKTQNLKCRRLLFES